MTHEVNTQMNKIASRHQVRTYGTISYSVINVQATLCPLERYNSVHDEF